ncbi:ComF family protein [Porphyrobacter sp. GA68]|uniref:ComF family protein n=1 Tax=Porphyrobacter sp. GA68 TaxID=2883480 RepID=UPI001D1845D1|nr:ComF family protein [Porphyrobacter sp. GA68]
MMGRAGKVLAEALGPVTDFIYPPRCPACGAGIGGQNGLCLGCWGSLEVPDAGAADPGEVIAATIYCDVSRKLILSFKHGRKFALAPLLARLIAARLSEPRPDRLIVPVPLHPLRLWQRGYNQSALLARELARLGHGTLLVDGLQRVRHTPSLDRRSAQQRDALLAGAIDTSPKRRCLIEGRNILLIDDVLTSGATTRACTAALRQSGASSVSIACFARVRPASSARHEVTETDARDLVIPGVA